MYLENKQVIGASITDNSFIEQVIHWGRAHNELILGYIANVVIAILIIIIGMYIAKILSSLLVQTLTKKKIDKTVVDFISAIVRYALMFIVLIASLGHVGIQTASFVAILSAAALAIGLALKGALSNFAAGILLIVLRPFSIGNYIEAAGAARDCRVYSVFS